MCPGTRDVKKQIHSSLKAHLLRTALILISVIAFSPHVFCQVSPTPTATPTPLISPTPTGTPSPSATAVCVRPTPGVCTSFEAEADVNTLMGSAFVLDCPTCSGQLKVGFVGSNSGTLQFNSVGVVVPGAHTITICYLNGDAERNALLSVNGGPGMSVSFPSTGSFQTVGSVQVTVILNTGCNTLKFYNPIAGDWGPDFDRITFDCPTCTVASPTPIPSPTPSPTPIPTPTPEGCYPKLATAEGCDALNFLTTGLGDTALGWRYPNPAMKEKYGTDAMGETAEQKMSSNQNSPVMRFCAVV